MATEDETTLSELISDGLSAVNGSILLKNEEDVNSATLSSTQVELQLKDELPSIPGTVSNTLSSVLYIFYFTRSPPFVVVPMKKTH